MMPIQNRNYFGAMEDGRQSRQKSIENQQRNALSKLEMDRYQSVNALMADPNATPEQFARAGRTDISNYIAGQQNDAVEEKRRNAKMLVQAAQYALESGSPKEFIRQNYPELAKRNPTFETDTDDQIRASLQEAIGVFGPQAGIGPAMQVTMEEGPNGSTIVRGDKSFKIVQPRAAAKPAPAQRVPSGYRVTADGGLEPIPGGPADPTRGAQDVKPPTEGERVAANYYGRMLAAEDLLGDFAPTTGQYMAAKKAMEGGTLTSAAANSLLDEKGQVFYQAAADWVRAKLRKESGAVISPEEMQQEIKTYFPMPGDSPAVIEQKRKARLQAQTGMQRMGGRASAEYEKKPAAGDGWTTLPNGLRIREKR